MLNRKPSLLIIMALLLALMTQWPLAAQDGGLLTSIQTNARFRTGPGTEWRIQSTLAPGTPINLDARDGTNNGWVRGVVPDGTVGWVAGNAVAAPADQLNALAIKGQADPFSATAPAGNAQPAPADSSAPVSDPAAPPPPVAGNLAAFTGFGYGGHVQDFNVTASSAMQRAGMTWVKRRVDYTDGASGAAFAGMIQDAHARGFRILLGVMGAKSDLTRPGYYERYGQFVGELAAAGADAIEVWNEPNIDREWIAGLISPAEYTNLLAASYNGIKRNNPATIVISGAPAPTGYFGECSGNGCDDIYWIQGLRDAGAARYMDCIGVHYNEGILPPTARSGDPRGSSTYYTRYFLPMIETYSGTFGGRLPLCFTELGYLSPEGFGALPPGFEWAGNVSVAQQAAWLDQAVSMARDGGRVSIFIIWNVDYNFYGADPAAGYAIIRPGGGCPACDALGS